VRVRVTLSSLVALAALAVAGIAAAPGSGDPGAHAAAPVKVSVGDNFFSPTKARVARGGKVKWTNNGKVEHNVTFSGGFASGNFGPGESVKRRFNRAGKFPYTCTIHPGMNGKVKVR
jgi:plastocyanin